MLKGRYENYDYWKHDRVYGRHPDGSEIQAPSGWVMLPEWTLVPHRHREFNVSETGRFAWCEPRASISTMTAIWATRWGHVLAYAVPEDSNYAALPMYPHLASPLPK